MRKKRILALGLAVSLLVSGIFCYNSLDKREVTADENGTKVLEISETDSKYTELAYLTGQEDALNDLKDKIKEYSEKLVNGEKDAADKLLPLISISTINYTYEYEQNLYDFTTDGEEVIEGYYEPYDGKSKDVLYAKNGDTFERTEDTENKDLYVFRPAYSGIVKSISKEAKLVEEPIYTKYFTKYKRLQNSGVDKEILGTAKASVTVDTNLITKDIVSYNNKVIHNIDVTVKKAKDVTVSDLDSFDLVYIDKDAGKINNDVANALFDKVAKQNIACVLNKDSSLISKDELNNTEKLNLALTMAYPSVLKKLVQMANNKGKETNIEVKDFITSFDTYASKNNSKGLVDTYIGYLVHQTDEKRDEEVESLGIDNESLSKDVAEHFVLALDDVIRTDSISIELSTTEELKDYISGILTNNVTYAKTNYTNEEIQDFDEKNLASLNMAFDFLLHAKRNTYNQVAINILEVEPCNDFFEDDYWDLKVSGKMPYSTEKVKVTRMQSKEYASYKGDVNSDFDFVYIGSKYGLLSHEESVSSETKWITLVRQENNSSLTVSYDKIGCNDEKVDYVCIPFTKDNLEQNDNFKKAEDFDCRNYNLKSYNIYSDINGNSYFGGNYLNYIGDKTSYGLSLKNEKEYCINCKTLESVPLSSLTLVGHASLEFNDNTFTISISDGYIVLPEIPIYLNKKLYTISLVSTVNEFGNTDISNKYITKGGTTALKANDTFQRVFSMTKLVDGSNWKLDKLENRNIVYTDVAYNDYASYADIEKNYKAFNETGWSSNSKYIESYKVAGTANEEFHLKPKLNTTNMTCTDVRITREVWYEQAAFTQTDNTSNTNEDGSIALKLYDCSFNSDNIKDGLYTLDELKNLGYYLSDTNTIINKGNNAVGSVKHIVKRSTKLFRVYLLPVTNASTTTIPTMYNDETMNGTLYNHVGDILYKSDNTTERYSGNDISKANYEALKNYTGILMFSDDFYKDGKLDETTFDKCSYVYMLAKDTKARGIGAISKQEVLKKLKGKTAWMIRPHTRIETEDENGNFSLDFTLVNAGMSLTDTMYYKCNLYIDYDTDSFVNKGDSTASFEIRDNDNIIVSPTRLKVGASYTLTTDFTEDDLKQLHGVIPYKFEVVTEKNETMFVTGLVTYKAKDKEIRVLTTEDIKDLPETKGYKFKFTKLSNLKQDFTNDTIIETDAKKNSIKLSDYNVLVTSYPVYDNDLQKLIALFRKNGHTVIYLNNKTDKKPLNQTRTAVHYNRFGIDDSGNIMSGFDKLLNKDIRQVGLKGYSESYLFTLADLSNSLNKYFIYNGVTRDTIGKTYTYDKTNGVKKVNDGQILVYPYDLSGKLDDLEGRSQMHQNFVSDTTSIFLTSGKKYDKDNPSTDIYVMDSGDTYNNAYCFATAESIYLGMTDTMNQTEKELFINALVMAYRNAPTKPDVYLLNEYSDKIDADEATLYVDADIKGTVENDEIPDLPENLLTEDINGKKVIKLSYSITNKDNVNDTIAILSTDKAYLYDSDKKEYVKSVKVRVEDGTNTYSFLVDSDILNTKDTVTLTTKTGNKTNTYLVRITKRKLLDLR